MPDNYLANSAYSSAGHFATRTDFEVQRTNHFEIVIDLESLNPPLRGLYEHIRLSTKSISAPKVTAEAIELKHGNDKVKVAAAPSYDDLTLTVYDTLGKDEIDVMQQWFNRVFDWNTKLMGMVSSYKTTATLYMFSPDGKVCRKWILEGVWPKEFGVASDFSFDTAEAQNVTVTLSVDRYHEETFS